MSDLKLTYILINISCNEDILFLSLIRLEDIIDVLKTSINTSILNNNKPLDILIAIFDNYGVCQNYKRHLIIPGIPINIIIKRVYYSVLLLIRDLNSSLPI